MVQKSLVHRVKPSAALRRPRGTIIHAVPLGKPKAEACLILTADKVACFMDQTTVDTPVDHLVIYLSRDSDPSMACAADIALGLAIDEVSNSIYADWDNLVQDSIQFGKPIINGRSAEHEKVGHIPYDPHCEECVRAAVKSKSHRRRKGVRNIGQLNVDIALYSQTGPYCLVGSTANTASKPVIVVEPIEDKSLAEIRRGVAALIIQAEHLWSSFLIQRVHGDRERGLLACAQDLHRAGIWAIVTQSYDPASNPAEGAMGIIPNAERLRLLRLTDANCLSEHTLRPLWPYAMVHAAMTFSAHHAPESAAIKKSEILVFGSKVILRNPPLKKTGKEESRVTDGIYFHPSTHTHHAALAGILQRLPGGHETKYLLTGVKDFVTVRRIASETCEPLFPFVRVQAKGRRNLIPNFGHQPVVPQSLRKSPRLAESRWTACKTDEYVALASELAALPEGVFEPRNEDTEESLIAAAMVTRLCTEAEKRLPEAKAAAEKEVSTLIKNNVIESTPVEEAPLPDGVEIGHSNDILSTKDVETDDPTFKGRLVFRGDIPYIKVSDGEGNYRLVRLKDFDDVWSANSADHASVRVLLAFALVYGFQTWTVDFANAYLQAEEGGRDVYVRVKPSLAKLLPAEVIKMRESIERPVHKLNRALYGRKRGGYDWGQKVISALEKRDFKKASHQNGLYFMKRKNLLVAIYVDDLAIAAPENLIDEIFADLMRDLEVKVNKDGSKWRVTKRFLGTSYDIRESPEARYALIDMEEYTRMLVSDFEKQHGTVRAVSRLSDVAPASDTRSTNGDRYRPLIGALLWLSRCLRAGISRSVSCLASAIVGWTTEHDDLIGYLKGTCDLI